MSKYAQIQDPRKWAKSDESKPDSEREFSDDRSRPRIPDLPIPIGAEPIEDTVLPPPAPVPPAVEEEPVADRMAKARAAKAAKRNEGN